MIPVSQLDEYTRQRGIWCVKPTGYDIDPESGLMPMCAAPATHVGVRKQDGWVSGTIWCSVHVAIDDARTDSIFSLFTWQPLDLSA